MGVMSSLIMMPACNLRINTWAHWVYVDNGSSVRAYMDGVLVDNPTSDDYHRGLEGLWSKYIGSRPGWGTNGLSGDLAVFNRALTPGEILHIYQNGQAGRSLAW